tara:strand:- start:487 stop:1431 length:945 start_codon:yes stop_codon:yes gene_type:complete
MGAAESHDSNCSIEDTQELKTKKDYYFDKYNWIPSLPGYEYDTIYMSNLRRKYDLTDQLPGYIDLRTSFPQIKSLNNLPFNPIISVIYILHYQLLKNNLPIFPPSVMYVYRNITFYRNVKCLFSFESIFNSIKSFGFCSENDLQTTNDNLNTHIDNKLIEKSGAFKFIEIYKVHQELEVIKTLLKHEVPVLVGFSVYYDLSNVDSYMWLPDEKLDKKLGGISMVLVGYIDEREMFIAATTFGNNYGTNGYIMIPYDYILNKNYTSELYTLDFKKERVEGYIAQRKEMVDLQNNRVINQENKKQYKQDSFGNLFK